MSAYIYECHGDFFDEWDDHCAASGYPADRSQQGYKPLAPVHVEDCEDERRRNIRAMHQFNANVAALEDARMAAQMRGDE